MINKIQTILFVLICLILLSCSQVDLITDSSESTSQSFPDNTAEVRYPIDKPTSDVDYGYPISSDFLFENQGPEFSINVPVKGGTVTVTGTGPAIVPIRLVNVSEVGLILGNTTIAPDGSFVFSLEEPLISGHMIGLQLGDISNTIFNEEDFLYSETYFERPFVGILFDLVVVE